MTDTIAAIATPLGSGGVGIVRVSGPNSVSIAKQLTDGVTPKHQHALFSHFYDHNHEQLDFGYMLHFKAPHSFTGEDIIEVQCHGGVVIMDMLLQRIVALGARIAEPGEFSKRAFLNDKIDLVQAEAIADLIACRSQASVKVTQRTLKGQFSRDIAQLSENIIQLRMYVEAALDFPEEEIDFIGDGQVRHKLQLLIEQAGLVLSKAEQGALLQNGAQVAIVGKPNAGKSTLINCLSGLDTAIVTDIPGTTRDVIKEQIVLDGVPISIIDTAGLRETSDVVEQEGVKRAEAAMQDADLILLVIDVNEDVDSAVLSFKAQYPVCKNLLVVINKIDVLVNCQLDLSSKHVAISAKQGIGLDSLKDSILADLGVESQFSEGAYTARRRHTESLLQVMSLLKIGLSNLDEHNAGELLAEDLRFGHQLLGEITGEFTSDDLLGRIFSSFCIGK